MKKLLASFVQVIEFLFAAFGGFLANIAPPAQTNPKFAVGLSSFLALIALLVVSALAKSAPAAKFRKRWITAGIICFVITVVAGLFYPWVLGRLTYSYPPPPDAAVAWHINGWELTSTAKTFIAKHPGQYSPGQLELKLPSDDIWTPESIAKAKMILLINYLALVLSIASAIFCLLEANFKSPGRVRSGSTGAH